MARHTSYEAHRRRTELEQKRLAKRALREAKRQLKVEMRRAVKS